jgi:hypothetical protein
LIKILEKVPELLNFNKFIERVTYLKKLPPNNESRVEEFLYEIYKPTLQIAATGNRAFVNFTKDNFE